MCSSALRANAPATLFLGDSITVGQGLNHPLTDRWTALVAKGEGWVEINEGKGGRPASALDEVRAILDRHKGDLRITRLVIALGGNDARDPAPDLAERVARDVGQIVDWARLDAPGWDITLVGPYDINREHLQHKEIADLREKNLRAINLTLAALAKVKGCHYIDFHGVLPPTSLTADGVHPDATGHAALAAAFLTTFPCSP